ncbi:hypothetical protein THIX_40066 [Thiomonas sp. X19]|nr:hypothetical protein THIX_40066 [Thiomonas sp. X19]
MVHTDQPAALFSGHHPRCIPQGCWICGVVARSGCDGPAGGDPAHRECAALPLFAGCLIGASLRWHARSHFDMGSVGGVTSSNKSNKIPGCYLMCIKGKHREAAQTCFLVFRYLSWAGSQTTACDGVGPCLDHPICPSFQAPWPPSPPMSWYAKPMLSWRQRWW